MRWIAIAAGVAAAGLVAVVALTVDRGGGTPLIGGPFELAEASGRKVTDKDFRGKLMLVFFGFTNCPDVCPAELQKIGVAMDKLGPKANGLAPLFISIDPERDTPKLVDAYAKSASPRIIGLSGTPDEIASVAKAYRVYYRKAPDKSGGYSMDHSTITYVMDRDGKYLTYFNFETSADAIAERLGKLL